MGGAEDRLPNKITLLGLIFLGFLFFATILVFKTEPLSYPDESAHFLYIHQLKLNNYRPLYFSAAAETTYEAHQPPLYYYLALFLYLLSKGNIYVIRLFSVVLGAIALFACLLISKEIFTEISLLPCFTTAIFALLPVNLVISTAISNDALAVVLVAFTSWLFIKVLKATLTLNYAIAIGLLLACAALTKTTTLILLPVAILTWLLSNNKRYINLLIMLCIFIALYSPWLIRNQILYQDALCWQEFKRVFTALGRPTPHDFFARYGLKSWYEYFTIVAMLSYFSFFGFADYSAMVIYTPLYLYIASCILILASLLGFLFKFRKKPAGHTLNSLVILSALVVLCILFLINFNLSFFQAQGRYLGIVALQLSVIAAYGLFFKYKKGWVSYLLPALLLVLLFLAFIYRLAGYKLALGRLF